jgi:transketolase
LATYRAKYPELATEIDQMQRRALPAEWDRNLPFFPADPKGIAGREASGKVLNVLAQNIPWFLGGSADLGPSNKTTLRYEGAGDFQADSPGGKNLHFSVREHAMAAIVNGLSLSKLRPFGATFFIFSDYARPAIRLSALMELPTIFVFTHDAMGDGEDGLTHQPVEQLVSLRAIPGLVVLRPGDANEVVEAYRYIVQLRHQPAVLALSRQPLPTLDRSRYAQASGVARGAYVLADPPAGNPEVILIASGSEVSLAVQAHERLLAEGIRSRVVSMPSWDIFEHQTQDYRDSVLPPRVKARVAVEQASILGWDRYVGTSGRVIGMKTFGASAPLQRAPEKVRLRAGPGGGGREGTIGEKVMDSTIAELDRRFGIRAIVKVVAGNGGLAKACITSAAATREMYLDGAHGTSWRPRDAEKVLFVSAQSPWESGQAGVFCAVKPGLRKRGARPLLGREDSQVCLNSANVTGKRHLKSSYPG